MKKVIAILCVFVVLLSGAVPVQAASKDTKAPTVTKISPANLATDIMIESNIVIRFSEKIVKGKAISKVSLKDADKESVPYTYEIKDNLLIITPKNKLNYNTQYTVSVPADAVKDKAGNSLKKSASSDFLTELDPNAKVDEKVSGSTYRFVIDANLDQEPTAENQRYLEEYMKLMGIDAKIISVEPVE